MLHFEALKINEFHFRQKHAHHAQRQMLYVKDNIMYIEKYLENVRGQKHSAKTIKLVAIAKMDPHGINNINAFLCFWIEINFQQI